MKGQKYFKEILQSNLDEYKNQGYEPIIKVIYDPAHSIISSDKNEKSFTKVIFCKCKDTCEAYKKGLCLKAGTSIFTQYCPFSKTYRLEGYTRRSKDYMPFIAASKEVLQTDENKFYQRVDGLRETIKIGDGSLVYIGLNHLNNYVNSCIKTLGIDEYNMIPTESFNEEVIRFLLNYRPEALFGGEITTYQKEEIPFFIRNLKTNFKELYKIVVEGTSYEGLQKTIKYKGKKAVLSTLKPGKVKILSKIYNWSGKELTTNEMIGIDVEKVIIIPKSGATVIIEEEETVDGNTIIRY